MSCRSLETAALDRATRFVSPLDRLERTTYPPEIVDGEAGVPPLLVFPSSLVVPFVAEAPRFLPVSPDQRKKDDGKMK